MRIGRERFREMSARWAKRLTGPLGIALIDLKDGEELHVQGDVVMPAASTFKVFILLELFRQAETGCLCLTDRLPLTESDKSPGTGVLWAMTEGLTPSIRDLAWLMMAVSDNTAADVLYRLVGPEQIQKHVLMELGLSNSRVDLCCREMISGYYETETRSGETSEEYFRRAVVRERRNAYFSCRSDHNTVTTARDMATALKAVYDGALAGPESAEQMMNIMFSCQTDTRIPAGLPARVRCAHKTGSLDRVSHDAGIIVTEEGDYILSMLYNGNLATDEEYEANAGRCLSDPVLGKISAEVYAALTGS